MQPALRAFDILHVILLTGFISTVVGITVHVFTKYTLSHTYVRRELFESNIEFIMEAHQEAMRTVTKNCEIARHGCPVVGLKEAIAEIRGIQRVGTAAILRREEHEDRIWRVVFDALKIPIKEQNELLDSNS